MGSRVASRLRTRGFDVVGYARSGAIPEGLEHAPTPAAAVHHADAALVFVTDDAASRAVWLGEHGILAGLRADALAIEQSTLSPAWIDELATHAGARFLDAPVVGSRPQADAGALVHLVGGSTAAFDRAQPLFDATGQAAHHVGPSPAGTHAKLVVNALFATQVALVGELLAFLNAAGPRSAAFAETLGALPVTSPAARVALHAMREHRHAPLFPATLAHKDLGYALAAAADLGVTLPLVTTARGRFAEALARGHGESNLTAVGLLDTTAEGSPL
ncbi:MAG: NAD(P)-dependent oxidoreductase [Sandaracinus sp.]|nr:NAD(P)-dependent oxidoreductase [Sandaracinus sp.]MCB9616966.1 NAD(P)-dependent oxidoreductase [Sandaracinus sp.]MCB9617853.1 NAD(P)-dependent oxidoreductase [Sandaracinus sp.]MCB9634597.1 NAD(P)-dependent oxidoreductase [Sandaracinus sp.]